MSLVPSQTELLFDLGLENEVVGITKFCVHPSSWFRRKQRIGGTKNIDLKKIAELNPDLIIANKEENVKEQVEDLAAAYPVWISDVNSLEDALQMIESIGIITGKEDAATAIAAEIRAGFAQLQAPNTQGQTNVAYLIWKDPYMTVGGDTFIHHMLKTAGYHNVFEQRNRYPAITITDLQQAACDLVFLSSEPYPFRQKHVDELALQLPKTTVVLVDGEMFSWYGSRLVQAPAYFQRLQSQINTAV